MELSKIKMPRLLSSHWIRSSKLDPSICMLKAPLVILMLKLELENPEKSKLLNLNGAVLVP